MFLVFFAFILTIRTCDGRLNETLEQCKVRYGEPIVLNKDNATAVFEKSEIRVQAHFAKGKVDRIEFSRIDGAPMEEADADVLVIANMGQKCAEIDDEYNPNHRRFSLFKNFDLGLTGEVDKSFKYVLLYTKEHEANLEQERNQNLEKERRKAASKLQGF